MTGIAAGATGILVLTGPEGADSKDKDRVPVGTRSFASLAEAADWIVAQ